MIRLMPLAALAVAGCGVLVTPAPDDSPVGAPQVSATPCGNVLLCALLEPTPSAVPASPRARATSTPRPVGTPSPPSTALPAAKFPDPDDYIWTEIVRGLVRPVDIQSAADGSGRLFVVEKAGRIRILQGDRLIARPFLDIRARVRSADKEQGLLGLAFHPDFARNGDFFVNYTAAGTGDTMISRFRLSEDPDLADPASEAVLLEIDQPYVNHNGGALAFGPDSYLYATLGDGGGIGDPFDHAQNTDSLLGKILRLNVDRGEPYVIPHDNPFGNEVWAYGFRNPWRLSFDRAGGALFVGDVGHLNWEEINYIAPDLPGGLNFGWDYFEGTHPYLGDASPEELTFPIAEYDHTSGCAIIGGRVYRGAMPEWNGIYFYGDYCLGTIWGLLNSAQGWQNQLLFDTRTTITSFGEDEAGEFYFASDDGRIHRFVQR